MWHADGQLSQPTELVFCQPLSRLGGTQTRTPLCGFRYRLCAAIGVDQGQSRERKMSALKIIRKRAKKAINLEAARKLMARRQLAGA